MLSKKEQRSQRSIDTIIGLNTIVEGKVTHPKSLRIDGKVIGEVICDGDVFIGKSGSVEPQIQAKNLTIAGTVDGKITITEKVHIMPTGKLSGTVTSKGIVIEEGGIFNGHSIIEQTKKVDKKSNNS